MNIELKNCKTVIFFGGPSNERNISLDSARTFYDSIRHHIPEDNLTLVFVSKNKEFYRLHPNWVYSNTIEDFEDLLEPHVRKTKKIFSLNLKQISSSNTLPEGRKNSKNYQDLKKQGLLVGKQLSTYDFNKLVDESHVFFPLIHGEFGEDGTLTSLINKRGRKSIIGSDSQVLYTSFKKHLAHESLRRIGLGGYPYIFISRKQWKKDHHITLKNIIEFSTQSKKTIQNGVVVKPNDCGSSDGVTIIEDVVDIDAIKKAIAYALEFSDEVLVEERIVGKEFSLIVFEDFSYYPVALYPTEIALVGKDSSNANLGGRFYSRQKKYMPGSGVEHITPARLPQAAIKQIRSEAELIFKTLNFQDWARFDGFYVTDSKSTSSASAKSVKNKFSGKVVWSDLNSQPGIGQDSLLFQQGIHLGIDTYNVSIYLLRKALAKEKIKLIGERQSDRRLQMIGVLGGGGTSERQVSRMSWCNVIEKLDRLKTYNLRYLFLDKQSHLWEVPRPYTLKHTTEEIERLIKNPLSTKLFMNYEKVYKKIKNIFPEVRKESFQVKKLNWLDLTKLVDYLFICLHGGIGENGTLQKRLASLQIPHNGSDAYISKLCFDKSANHALVEVVREINTLKRDYGSSRIHLPKQTAISITALKTALAKRGISYQDINVLVTAIFQNTAAAHEVCFINRAHQRSYNDFAKTVIGEINSQIKINKISRKNSSVSLLTLNDLLKGKFIIKPSADGCSTGVVVCNDFEKTVPLYFLLLLSKYRMVPASLFGAMEGVGDKLNGVENRFLVFSSSSQKKVVFEEFLDVGEGYLELTVGVMGERGKMIALLPSKTIAETQVLSLDEKFNKGVGPNLTPPRELNVEQIATIRAEVADFANKIGLKDYARIDLFYHPGKNELYLIEVNTLPGLTAATILFTQALVTPQAQYPPSEFLDKIISFSRPKS